MSYDTWVRNDIYNSAVHRSNQLGREKGAVDRKVKRAKSDLEKVESMIESQSNIDQRDLENKLTKESEALLASIDGVSDELRLEIGRQNVRFQEEINSLRATTSALDNRISQSEGRISDLVSEFQSRFREIADRIDDKKVRAELYCRQLQLMLGNINALHPDKLTPGEAELISESLAYVNTNINNGDYEAAISLSQSKIPDASELHSRLEVINDEYAELVVRIHEECVPLIERIASLKDPNKNPCTISHDGKEGLFDGRISFWSSGLLDEIESRFIGICNLIENKYEVEMDIDNLRIALNEIGLFDRQLNECVTLAHDEFYESLRVQFLAMSIYESMTKDDSWNLHSDITGFEDKDERRPYKMVFDDGSGNIASVVVFHNRDIKNRTRRGIEYGETQFRVDICDGELVTDAHLCEITKRGLLSTLEESGIDIGNYNRQTTSISNSSSSDFIANSIMDGDRIKDGRINIARTNIGIR